MSRKETPGCSSRPGLIEGLERKLYCYCRQPTSKDLIGCDHCPEWYHPDCLNLSPASVRTILQLPSWRCPECQAREDEVKLHHRQLQLPIPRGAQFCEVKTSRLESWGLQDYQDQGWVPVTSNTWRTLDQADTTTGTPVITERRKRKGTIPFDPEQYERLCKMSKEKAEARCDKRNKENVIKESEPELTKEQEEEQLEKNTKTTRGRPRNKNSKQIKENVIREPEPELTEKQEDDQSEKYTKTTRGRPRNKNSKQTNTDGNKLTHREEDTVETANNVATENNVANGNLNDKAPRTRLVQNNESSKGLNSTEEEDPEDLDIQPYDELFFCYVCKSIFVSKAALENHQSQNHNV